TTFLQRELAAYTANVRTLSLIDIALPSNSLQAAMGGVSRALAKVHPSEASGLRRAVSTMEDRWFGSIKRMHDLRFDQPAEDEFVLWSIFSSATCLNDSPHSAVIADDYHLRDHSRWSPELNARSFGWYKACLLKKLSREPRGDGGTLWAMSKNPAFTQRIIQLYRWFPEARFVYLVRTPLQTIPSRLSLLTQIWKTRTKSFTKMSAEQVRVIVDDSCRAYLAAETQLAEIPQSRQLVVPYTELRQNPGAILASICEKFGIDGVGDTTPVPGVYISQHTYGLDDYGLSERDLRSRLAPVFERYGF
ncbi:MAG: sulfotransferase, partial [Proteobacteria bacterium]|nr:sulfotransferase [Pseudomonadota bacterium]